MKNSPQKRTGSETGREPHEPSANQQEVGRRAYELWESSGHRHGEDVHHWLAAERTVRAQCKPENNTI